MLSQCMSWTYIDYDVYKMRPYLNSVGHVPCEIGN